MRESHRGTFISGFSLFFSGHSTSCGKASSSYSQIISFLTPLLLPPPPLVADLDGADREDDGHDEELREKEDWNKNVSSCGKSN